MTIDERIEFLMHSIESHDVKIPKDFRDATFTGPELLLGESFPWVTSSLVIIAAK